MIKKDAIVKDIFAVEQFICLAVTEAFVGSYASGIKSSSELAHARWLDSEWNGRYSVLLLGRRTQDMESR